MATKKVSKNQTRLAKNKVVIDDWLERKVYEIPYESFLRIKYSLLEEDVEGLTQRELFIRSLARYYKKNYGKWPAIFRA